MRCRAGAVEVSAAAARILAERRRVHDAVPVGPADKIKGELRDLSDGDLRVVCSDYSMNSDHNRRERASLILYARRQKEFWSKH